jgi:hypothetical protein
MPGDPFKIYYGKDLSNGSIVSLQNLQVAGSASEVRTIGNVTLVIPTSVPLRSRLVPPVVVVALAIGAEVCAIRSGWPLWLLIPILLVAIWVLKLEKVNPVIDTSVMPSEGPGGEGKTWYRLPSGKGGEAERFVEALGIAERVRETWPQMGHMVDPSEADPLMARALWDLAGVLNRHSKARSITQRLKEHDRTGIPRDSAALRDRRDVLKRASKLLKREDEAVDAHIEAFRVTAVDVG